MPYLYSLSEISPFALEQWSSHLFSMICYSIVGHFVFNQVQIFQCANFPEVSHCYNVPLGIINHTEKLQIKKNKQTKLGLLIDDFVLRCINTVCI